MPKHTSPGKKEEVQVVHILAYDSNPMAHKSSWGCCRSDTGIRCIGEDKYKGMLFVILKYFSFFVLHIYYRSLENTEAKKKKKSPLDLAIQRSMLLSSCYLFPLFSKYLTQGFFVLYLLWDPTDLGAFFKIDFFGI